MQLAFGFGLGILIAWAAWRAGSLSHSGAVAAAVTGGLIFGVGGLPWAVLLLTFFISSSALSHAFSKRKRGLAEKFAKGSRRDWGQVLANGGLGALLALAHGVLPGAELPWLAFVGAMAAVNADTWATELGVLSRSQPRLITTLRPVAVGESGAVSGLGLAASLAGALLIGLAAALFSPPEQFISLLAAAALGGLAGSLIDSLLGATLQAIYWCPICEKETERHPEHTCGTETTLQRGWAWLENDRVNFACSLVGALAAALIGLALG